MSSYFDQFNVMSMVGGWFTNVSVGFLLALLVLYLVLPSEFLLPRSIDIIWEALLTHWSQVLSDSMGESGKSFTLPLISLFSILLVTNLLGFFPYTYTITAQAMVTFSLSFTIVLSTFVVGIMKFSLDFFCIWMPQGAPMALAPLLVLMETVSYFSSALSLGLSLAANLSAGHLLMIMLGSFTFQLMAAKVISLSLMAMLIALFVVILEMAVAAMQAYVFCLLTAVYLSDTAHLH